MEGISDIKIIGIDEKRPPVIRKQPYIDIYFKLSHKAPLDWCKDFNNLLAKHPATPKIKETEGLFIEAWVRTPDEIVEFVDQLKESVAECTRQYIARIELASRNIGDENNSSVPESSEQNRLNSILDRLDFSDSES